MFKQPKFVFLFLILALVSFYVLIWGVDKKPLALWDESRQAINAYEMHKTGDFTTSTYHYKRDLWNTKPHLLVALQAIGFYANGPSLTALRIPSALAALFTVLLIFVFVSKNINAFVGFASGMFLLTCFGLTQEHVASTGDYDALLMFFVLCSSLFLFQFVQTNARSKLYFFFVFVALSFFTKGVAVLLWTPAWALFLLTKEQLVKTLKNKHFWFGTTGVLLLIFSYYGLQELITKGFISAAWKNEISGRLLKPNEGHNTEWWFYFVELYEYAFAYWFIIVPAMVVSLLSKNKNIKSISIWASILSIVFLFILSCAKTRIYWYMAPVYPFFAIVCGIGIWDALDLLIPQHRRRQLKPILFFLILLMVTVVPFLKVFDQKNEIAITNDYKKDIAITFRNIENRKFIWPKECKLISDGYEPILEYYQIILKDKNLGLPVSPINDAEVGDTICVFTTDQKDKIERLFKTKTLLLVPHSYCYVLVETK